MIVLEGYSDLNCSDFARPRPDLNICPELSGFPPRPCPAGRLAKRRSGMHLGDRQRQSCSDRQALSRVAEARCGPAAGRIERRAQDCRTAGDDSRAKAGGHVLRRRLEMRDGAPAARRPDGRAGEECDRRLETAGLHDNGFGPQRDACGGLAKIARVFTFSPEYCLHLLGNFIGSRPFSNLTCGTVGISNVRFTISA